MSQLDKLPDLNEPTQTISAISSTSEPENNRSDIMEIVLSNKMYAM